MKIKLITSKNGRWSGPSGKVYRFSGSRLAEVNLPEDQLFFLKSGKGTNFSTEEKVDLKELEAIVKKAQEIKEEQEESVRGRNRKVLEPKPVKKEEKKIHTFPELKAGGRRFQFPLVTKLDSKVEIPEDETTRIKLIMKLEGQDVTKIEDKGKEPKVKLPDNVDDSDKAKRYSELEALNKPKQVEMIKKLDPKAEIPKLEDGRIELIMKLEA